MAFDFATLRKSFFDAAAVSGAVSAAKRKQFPKAGAFVRQRARTSIRRKKGVSQPGQPPHAHSGQIKLIFFAYDARTEGVVVGPIIFTARRGPKMGAKLLEHGGEATVQETRGPRRLLFRARPFMLPALRAEMPKFAGLFKGSLGGS